VSTGYHLGRRLLRTALLAVTLTTLFTFGLMVEEGTRREVTDRALSVLLLTTLPISACVAVWGVGPFFDPLVAFGASRRESTLRRFAPYFWGLPLTMSALTVVVLAWARGIRDPRLGADLLATMPVTVMAVGAMLFCFLAVGQWFGRAGLVVLLLTCVTLGQSELTAAIVLPGAHVRHLLGVGAALPFDPAWSMAALWAFAVGGFSAWILRTAP
jgi:hypothetical protein